MPRATKAPGRRPSRSLYNRRVARQSSLSPRGGPAPAAKRVTGRRRSFVWCSLLVLVLLAAYSNHFQNEFHFDDFHTISNNPFIRELRNIPRFFTDPTLFSVMPDHATWRPMVSVSLALDYWLGRGLNPFYFHLSTFIWFAVQLILMVFLFGRIMDLADPHPANFYAALFGAALYGLDPANAETVNYVIQRGDLYSTLDLVASLLFFIAGRSPESPLRRRGWYLLLVVTACLSKAPALIFPFILLSYVYLFETEETGARRRWWVAVRATVPAFLVTAAMAVLTWGMTPHSFVAGAASGWRYRVTQPWVALHYLKSFFLPTGLSADTDWGYVATPYSIQAVAGYLAVAGLLALAWWTARRRETRPIAFGIAWFLLALLPTSLMPLAEVTNDHRMFFPFVGLALAVVWTLRLALSRRAPRLAIAGGLAVLLVFLLGTRARNEVWRTEESLWRDVTLKSPRNGRGLMNYGLIFMARGDYATALSYYDRALLYTPNYWALEVNMGIALGAVDRDAEAERHFHRALALAPGIADPYFYYGRWLRSAGRIGESAMQLEAAVSVNGFAFDARHLLMQVYSELGNRGALDRLAKETLQMAPDDATARQFLGQRE